MITLMFILSFAEVVYSDGRVAVEYEYEHYYIYEKKETDTHISYVCKKVGGGNYVIFYSKINHRVLLYKKSLVGYKLVSASPRKRSVTFIE